MKENYKPAEVAELLGVSRQTIYNWIRAGKLEAKKLGGVVRISREQLERFTGESAAETAQK